VDVVKVGTGSGTELGRKLRYTRARVFKELNTNPIIDLSGRHERGSGGFGWSFRLFLDWVQFRGKYS
jgi:hypothetical protein